MAWFSPVKGVYPSLAQIDKTLPIDGSIEDLKSIKRGIVMHVDGATNTFALGAAEGNTYVSLQNYDDTQAEFAGGVWFGKGKTDIANGTESPGTPSVTGLSMTMAGEYETDNFLGEIKVGDKLTAGADGVIVAVQAPAEGEAAEAAEGEAAEESTSAVFAICTAAPAFRWVNNAEVTSGYGASRRQGASVQVIRFKTI